jgi:thymidine kinase
MPLTLILGPMKSGKSLELIQHFAPLTFSNIPFVLYQSARNVRDEHIASRGGVAISAEKITRIPDGVEERYRVVGIDEAHMFLAQDIVPAIERLLRQNIDVIVAGLDTDYQGKMFDVIRALFELGPKDVRYKRSVCDLCRIPGAVYSQVLKNDQPLTAGMPPVIPDDGTYSYRAACRNCFVRE